jgi:peptide/nickel transport system substrate-binding protein
MSRISRRNFLLRSAGVAGLALAGADFLAACGSSSKGSSSTTLGGGTGTSTGGGAGSPKPGGTIKVGLLAPTAAVDPVLMYDAGSIAVAQQVAEYLVWVENDGSLRPVLAQSWTPDAAAKVWTFKLRPGVLFSDGTPFSADDVVASMAKLTDPNSQSSALTQFKGILGPAGTVKVDDTTVAFHLNVPFVDFPYLVSSTNYNALILPKNADHTKFQSAAVGTGPFLLKSFVTNQSAAFVRNPKYWGAPKPYLDGATFTFFKDQQSTLNAFQGGTLDAMLATSSDELATLQGASGTKVLHTAGSATYTLWMRADKAPFTDKRVRQAVAWALDRTGLVSSVLNGDAQIGNDHFFGPTMPLRPTNLTQRAQDLNQAKQLLQAAGAVGKNVTLTTENTPPAPDYAALVKSDLAKIGLNVTLDVMDQTAFYGSGHNQPWLEVPFGIVDWAARSIPSQFLVPVMTSSGTWNSAHYANPTLDALISRYNGELDKTQRQALVNQIAQISWEDVPVIVGYWSGGDRAMSSKLEGLQSSASSFLDLTSTWIS